MRFTPLGKLSLAALIVVLGLTTVIIPTNTVKAGADEVIRVRTLFHVKVGNGDPPIEDCGIIPWVSYQPVVGNGTGHYYNYHIMNAPGHSAHSCVVVNTVTFGPYDYFVDSCSGYN